MITKHANKQEETYFRVMRILHNNPDLTQRELAQKLGISLGGLNFCLNALIDKGFIKLSNFQQSKNKFKYVYLLTPQGIAEKLTMTSRFLKLKIDEYDALKVEIEALKADVVVGQGIDKKASNP
jgi:EPS-associated MarR family transcriptional regulator